MSPMIKHKPRLIILIGPAYSGKTAWAKRFLSEQGKNSAVIIQREAIYKLTSGSRYPDDVALEVAETMIEVGIARALSLNQDVVLDGRHTKIDELSTIIETFTHTARIYYKIFEVSEEIFFNRRMVVNYSDGEAATLREYNEDTYNLDIIREQLTWYPEVKAYSIANSQSLFTT